MDLCKDSSILLPFKLFRSGPLPLPPNIGLLDLSTVLTGGLCT